MLNIGVSGKEERAPEFKEGHVMEKESGGDQAQICPNLMAVGGLERCGW